MIAAVVVVVTVALHFVQCDLLTSILAFYSGSKDACFSKIPLLFWLPSCLSFAGKLVTWSWHVFCKSIFPFIFSIFLIKSVCSWPVVCTSLVSFSAVENKLGQNAPLSKANGYELWEYPLFFPLLPDLFAGIGATFILYHLPMSYTFRYLSKREKSVLLFTTTQLCFSMLASFPCNGLSCYAFHTNPFFFTSFFSKLAHHDLLQKSFPLFSIFRVSLVNNLLPILPKIIESE